MLRAIACEKFKAEFAPETDTTELTQAIEKVYSSTPSSNRGLRDIVILSAAVRAGELFKDDEFDQMTERVGEFGRDLAKHFSTRTMVANKPDVAPVADVPGIICNFCHVKFVPDRVEIGEGAWCPHCGTVMYQVTLEHGRIHGPEVLGDALEEASTS